MGNRIIGGGLGPYLSKIKLDGNDEKNAPLVDRDLTNVVKFPGIHPGLYVFGEPVSGAYLLARSPVRALKFEYLLNDDPITHGDLPMFEPGDLELSAMHGRGGNIGAVRLVKGLKGRPYLKVDYDQVGKETLFFCELSGLHLTHLLDEEKNDELHERVQFEMIQDEEVSLTEDGKLILEEDFTGRFDVEATFLETGITSPQPGQNFLAGARSGKVFKPGDELFDSVSIRVKDLDGYKRKDSCPEGRKLLWQLPRGLGERKFKRWVEFARR